MSQEHSPATLSEDSSDATARMLPCPSCGETDVDATFAAGVKGGEREERFYNAGCMVCGMTGPDSHTAQDAADRWNALPRTTVSEIAQKPVAWRYKLKGSSMPWRLVESESDCNQLASYEREPLFASFPSTTPRSSFYCATEQGDGENAGVPCSFQCVGCEYSELKRRLAELETIPALKPDSAASATPCSGDAKDAARYRWLRDLSVPPHNFYISVPVEFKDERYTPQQVDAAIDAAMRRPDGGKQT